jgi:hypothetical protein
MCQPSVFDLDVVRMNPRRGHSTRTAYNQECVGSGELAMHSLFRDMTHEISSPLDEVEISAIGAGLCQSFVEVRHSDPMHSEYG